jgi:hypothetical protein
MTLADDPLFQALAKKVAMQAELNAGMALELERNSRATDEINCKVDTISADTKEVISAFKQAKAAFDLLETASKVAKVMIPLVVACGYLGYAGESSGSGLKSVAGVGH